MQGRPELLPREQRPQVQPSPTFVASFPRSPSAAFGRLRSPGVRLWDGGREQGGHCGLAVLPGARVCPLRLHPCRNLRLVCKCCYGKRSASRSAAKATGARASRALCGSRISGCPALCSTFPWPLSSPFRSRVGSVTTEAHTHPSLLAVFWHPFRCKAGAEHSVGGNLQDLVASALSADTLPSYRLSQRPQGGLQQAANRARLAHFTS